MNVKEFERFLELRSLKENKRLSGFEFTELKDLTSKLEQILFNSQDVRENITSKIIKEINNYIINDSNNDSYIFNKFKLLREALHLLDYANTFKKVQ